MKMEEFEEPAENGNGRYIASALGTLLFTLTASFPFCYGIMQIFTKLLAQYGGGLAFMAVIGMMAAPIYLAADLIKLKSQNGNAK